MTKKGRIINLELLYSYEENDDLIELLRQRAFADIDKAIYDGCNSIIALMMCDGFLYRNNDRFYDFLKELDTIRSEKNIDDFVLITGMVGEYQKELDRRNISFKIIQYDQTLNMVYHSYKNKLSNLPQWNAESNKFLFLTGVPSRTNRIGLLYKIYRENLLTQSVYSFFPPWTDNDKLLCRKILDFLDDDQYSDLIEKLPSKVDDLYDLGKEYTTANGKQIIDKKLHETDWFKDVSKIDASIFTNTVLSVISEGCVFPPGDDYRFLTEKTWRTVCNNHPFLFAGHTDMYDYMKARGLRDVSNYVKIKEYGSIKDENERYEALVENIDSFLRNFRQHKDEISADIKHNHQVFLEGAEKNSQIIEFLKRQYSIDDNEIEYWFFRANFIPYVQVHID